MSKNALPLAFEVRMKEYLGASAFKAFSEALDQHPPVAIRYNPFKRIDPIEHSGKVLWATNGFYLKERPVFTLDPNFHAGAYYVQEASSMFLEHILEVLQPERSGIFLDLSAAPGGKTTLMSTYLGLEGFLVANEVIKARASVLKENVIKWGLGNTLVTHNDPDHFSDLAGYFDLVLVDAPCSGEGMFRKDQDARNEWSPDHVQLCASRQERIMDHAGALVKAGGLLIYSTCTFNERENEDMVRFICQEYSYQPVRIPLDPEWQIDEIEIETEGNVFYGYKFFPHKVQGEGFFVAVFQRPEDCPELQIKRAKEFKHPYIKPVGKSEAERLKQELHLPNTSVFYNLKDSYFWVNSRFQHDFEFLSRFLNIRYFGVELGKFNKQQFIPNHEFALSILPKIGYPTLLVDMEEALDFLAKEDKHYSDLPEGWVLICYQSLPLGWIKNLGNRSNNYYPKEWRIKMRRNT
jgi:16S rRNA C967 or C1407 C5-methylase (RsmB/RsmF family)/NOL1/NOP2/fmu family ribosome biogenesis protein